MKVILYIIVGVGTVYLASIVTPGDIKNRALAAIGLSDFSVTEIISNTKDIVVDKIVPKSSYEKRIELIERLDESIKEIEEAQEKYGVIPETKVVTGGIIEDTKLVIEELKQENEKSKQGAISSIFHATADVISAVANAISGGDEHEEGQVCEVEN